MSFDLFNAKGKLFKTKYLFLYSQKDIIISEVNEIYETYNLEKNYEIY